METSESNEVNLYNKFRILEDSYKIILDEIPQFDITNITMKRQRNEWFGHNEGLTFIQKINNTEWHRAWDKSEKWFNFPLMYNNNIVGTSETICPNTIKILKEIGGINIAGFSLLLPDSTLEIHTDSTGPNNNSMALNMCLIGEKSHLYVKHDNIFHTYTHENGKLVIFNSENEHYADNLGVTNRIILYIDFQT